MYVPIELLAALAGTGFIVYNMWIVIQIKWLLEENSNISKRVRSLEK